MHMIGVTSAGEGRLSDRLRIGVSMIDPISRGQAQRDSRARPAARRRTRGPFPRRDSAGSAFRRRRAGALRMVLKILFTAAAASKHIDFQRALVRNLWAVQGAVGGFECTASPRFS